MLTGVHESTQAQPRLGVDGVQDGLPAGRVAHRGAPQQYLRPGDDEVRAPGVEHRQQRRDERSESPLVGHVALDHQLGVAHRVVPGAVGGQRVGEQCHGVQVPAGHGGRGADVGHVPGVGAGLRVAVGVDERDQQPGGVEPGPHVGCGVRLGRDGAHDPAGGVRTTVPQQRRHGADGLGPVPLVGCAGAGAGGRGLRVVTGAVGVPGEFGQGAQVGRGREGVDLPPGAQQQRVGLRPAGARAHRATGQPQAGSGDIGAPGLQRLGRGLVQRRVGPGGFGPVGADEVRGDDPGLGTVLVQHLRGAAMQAEALLRRQVGQDGADDARVA
ncbi:hypothetical protein [Streptomyces sp. WMMC897]|uniref:hypothetical protein n=1 Tax=Streptomyces sp. WMMC897 TaxID=3014782 RepID=UPI0022B60939|nr:hypothetical protein [Streptomyces sp. WMMC897]MCZ7417892.1 hypothetical protein [Streptomyces sp. WMMC897]